jgi:hypothetical protein
MSAILGANTAYKAGLVSQLPEEGELKLDALSADVISQGDVLWNDYANATAGSRGWKKVGTAGAETGPYAVATKSKIAGEVKVTGVTEGARVSVTAGGTIAGGAYVKPSATTAGAVDQWIPGTDAVALKVGRYWRAAKYSNSGDGNNAIGSAIAGQVIVIEIVDN